MPQMAPMNWLLMYIMFFMLFILINFLNYYKYKINNKKIKIKNYLNNMYYWKW